MSDTPQAKKTAGQPSETALYRRFDSLMLRLETNVKGSTERLQALLQENVDRMVEAINHIDIKIGQITDNTIQAEHVEIGGGSSSAELLAAQLVSLTEISELRAEIARLSVEQAEKAMERRIEAINIIENSNYYVTKPDFDAKMDQVGKEQSALRTTIAALRIKLVGTILALTSCVLLVDWVLHRP